MGKPPFPRTPHTLIAPPTWRCIDFISDLHLHEGLPGTTQALADYLANTSADAVLILGDLFEAWVGDDMRTQPYEAECTRILAQAGQRLHLGVMVGNRDFLLGTDMLSACHAHPLGDPTVLLAWGGRTLLTHGDALCLADTDYLHFRAQVRQAAWQQSFLAKPLDERLDQARRMREASQAHQQVQASTSMGWADVDEGAATDWMRGAQSLRLIHGHTHQPGDHPFGPPGGMRHVLSDWDLDHAQHPRAQILRLTEAGLQRLALTQNMH